MLYANTTNVVSGASNTGVGPFDITLAPDLYDIRFTDVTGYNTPALIQDVNITNGVTEVRHGEYTPGTNPTNTGTIIVQVIDDSGSPINGQWTLAGPSSANGMGGQTIRNALVGTYTVAATLPAGGVYSSVTISPLNTQTLNANSTIIFTITYQRAAQLGTVIVEVQNSNGTPINDGNWDLFRCSTMDISSCNIPVRSGNAGTSFSAAPAQYYIRANAAAGYIGQIISSVNPQVLAIGGTITFTIVYTPQLQNTGYIQATTVSSDNNPIATGNIFIDGQSVGMPASAGAFVPVAPGFAVNVTQLHTISFGSIPGYITPADIVINANTIIAGQTNRYTGTYVPLSGPIGTVVINVVDQNGTVVNDGAWSLSGPITRSGTAGSTLTNSPVGDYSLVATLPVGGAYNAVAVTPAASQTLAANGTITFNVVYQRPVGNGDIIIQVVDQNNNPVVGEWTLSGPQNQGGTTGTTLTGVPAGDYTLAAVVPTGSTFTGFSITPSNTQTLANGAQITFVITYQIPVLRTVLLTKTVSEQIVANNNKRVDYTLTLSRTDAGNTTPIDIQLSDDITGNGTLTSGNGRMDYVLNTFSCSSGCSATSADGIANRAVTVTLDTGNSTAIIRYQMLSNNSAQTAAATFTNTAFAAYKEPLNGGNPIEVTASASVTVQPRPGVNPGGPTVYLGGYGGNNDGTVVPDRNGTRGFQPNNPAHVGAMDLEIDTTVTTRQKTYETTSTSAPALLANNRDESVTVQVRVKNLGNVSVKNVTFNHVFNAGDSTLKAGAITQPKNVQLKNQQLVIDKIKVNEVITFSYVVPITSGRANSALATDQLILADYRANVPAGLDVLSYQGIGRTLSNYFANGSTVTTPEPNPSTPDVTPHRLASNGSDTLRITVQTDRAEARVGETIDYQIHVTNLTEEAMTGLALNFYYPANFAIVTSGGARNDGKNLEWQRALLNAGETVHYTFQVKVVSGADNTAVRTLTTGQINEFENIPPTAHYIGLIGGSAPTPGRSYQLAQTGAGTFLMLILAMLSALGYRRYQTTRYQRIKRDALM
ncbi:hypothetical protein IPJ72_04770 [Candidatus Peregrinibacteria bacterium]|nr:MAG: hypothetical protein IPJ72_04770 [Candidatus Peregrinibacteria bacterium]